jgi:uncharacterized membrane protein
MKLLGLLLLPAGWIIVLAAISLLPASPAQTGFVFAGISVEALGLAFLVRAHASSRGNRK